MPTWVVMRDGDCLAHRFYSENIDTAAREAKAYANKLAPGTLWVCTLLKNKNDFDYNYETKRWFKKEIKVKPKVSMKSNKKLKSQRRKEEEDMKKMKCDIYN